MQVKDMEEGTKMGKVIEQVKLTSLFEQEKSVEVYSDSGHSALLRTFPFGSLDRRICGFSFGYAQICLRQTSHIPRTLYAICRCRNKFKEV